MQELRAAGYLPEAVDNYIALLGAGFAADEEHFSLAELAERFRLERVSKNPAVFDERKLRHINGRWLRELGVDELTRRLEEFTGRSGLRGAVEISAEKIQTLAEFWPLVGFVFDGPADDQAAFEKTIGADGGVERLQAARDALAGAEPFTVDAIEAALRGGGRAPGQQAGQGVPAACGSRSQERRSLRASSKASRCSDARRRSRGIDRALERASACA